MVTENSEVNSTFLVSRKLDFPLLRFARESGFICSRLYRGGQRSANGAPSSVGVLSERVEIPRNNILIRSRFPSIKGLERLGIKLPISRFMSCGRVHVLFGSIFVVEHSNENVAFPRTICRTRMPSAFRYLTAMRYPFSMSGIGIGTALHGMHRFPNLSGCGSNGKGPMAANRGGLESSTSTVMTKIKSTAAR